MGPFDRSLTGLAGVFANDFLIGVEIGFFGDGVGGSTLGSFARNDLTGVLALFTRSFTTVDLIIVGDELLSSGNCSRFNRRRTS